MVLACQQTLCGTSFLRNVALQVMKEVLRTLCEKEYSAVWGTLLAKEVGAPLHRPRCWPHACKWISSRLEKVAVRAERVCIGLPAPQLARAGGFVSLGRLRLGGQLFNKLSSSRRILINGMPWCRPHGTGRTSHRWRSGFFTPAARRTRTG